MSGLLKLKNKVTVSNAYVGLLKKLDNSDYADDDEVLFTDMTST